MLAQTAAFFGGLPVGNTAHTRSRLGKRNGVTHHVYTKSQVLCGSDLDVREPRPTTLHAPTPARFPRNRKPCIINHYVDIRR
jgi:hypothetical protein